MGSLTMLTLFLLLSLFLFVASSSFESSSFSSAPQLSSHEEAAALLHFKNSFSIDQNILISVDECGSNARPKTDSWKEGVDCCSWDGVRCDNLTGRVVDLDLGCSQLSGSFPSNNTLFILKSLQSLNLSFNDFQGSKIPSEIGRLSNLKFLDLSYSMFSGPVPGEISHLSKLVSLNISAYDYQLIVEPITLRNLVHNLSQVREFFLSYINMSYVDPRLFMNLSTSLTTLSINECGLEGSIPSSLLNLPELSYLDLSDNSLSGPIPAVHPNRLSKLSSLYLNNNLLNGTIPPWIFTLPQLRSLDLSYNQLEGQLSQFQTHSLEYLDLSNNRIHGSIPSSISNQVNLSVLYLWSNNFNGILEFDMFSNLQNLRSLGMSNNSLSFRNGINANFTLPSLESLSLSGCGVSQFPNFIRNSTRLRFLDLSNNRIAGQIPKWMWDTGKDTLQYLILSNNSLSGAFEELPWKNIEILNLQSNKLQGALPIPPNGTRVFQISNNYFDGPISSEICNVDTLGILDLSRNNFNGNVPGCLLHKSSKYLRVLNLQVNKFNGAIPSEFPKGCGLHNLNLQGNQMEGPLPKSLVNCGELEVLDVGSNNINDTFPHWLESLTELQVLVLRSNRFHGFVSNNAKTKSSFPKLRILDLSNNDLGGPLPVQYIEHLKAMVDAHQEDNSSQYMEVRETSTYRFSVVVTMKGFTIDLQNILTIFTSIDLSKNKFVGEIPYVIGKLGSLKGLNLSYNNLGGRIPPSLGNLSNLEWLDLSSNELVGKIPEELVSVTQLGTLNLSNNQLVGRIPQGKQFDTFRNDSYRGNIGLYGPPLSKTCGGNGIDVQPPTSFQERDVFWEFITWRVVGLGFGCGTLFGLLMGYVMFKTGRPKWFASTFDLYPYLRGRRMKRAKRRIQRRN